MRLIDADALSNAMFESVFGKVIDEHVWISRCWIRYKMFEWNISNAPTIDAVPAERIKKCLMDIADNQIANAPDECDSDNERRYKSGVWNGLQMAYEIVSQLAGNSDQSSEADGASP